MSNRTAIVGARRYSKGQLSKDELVAMAMRFRNQKVRDAALELAREIDHSAADALLYDGDLTIEGDLDTGDWGDSEDRETEGTLLVVTGNLVVRRLYRDACNDAPDLVVVGGDVRAENVITAGMLDVRGSLIVSNVLVGDYNDGAAYIGGDIEARLFVPADHYFEVNGALRCEYFVEGTNELDIPTTPSSVEWQEVPLDDPDHSTIIKRLRANQRVLR